MRKCGHILGLCMFIGVCAMSRAASDGDWTSDYSNLTIDTLPPLTVLTERVLEAAPYSEDRLMELQERIRRSALLPMFRVDYVIREDNLFLFGPETEFERTRQYGGGQQETQVMTYEAQRLGNDPGSSFIDTRVEHLDRPSHRDPFTRDIVREGNIVPQGQEMRWANEWRALLIWDLTRLVFHRDEPRAVDVQMRISHHRRNLAKDVSRRYGRLRMTLINLQRDPDNPRLQDMRLLDASFLDALSDFFITDYIAMKKLEREIEQQQARNPAKQETVGDGGRERNSEENRTGRDDLYSPVPLRTP